MALTQVASGLIASVSGASLTGTQNIPKATLPTGCVLQVVNATSSTEYSTSSNTLVASGFTVSITPLFSTSKVLILSRVPSRNTNASTPYGAVAWFRGGSSLITTSNYEIGANNPSANQDLRAQTSQIILDSPATTSSVTYSLYFVCNGSAGSFYINPNSAFSTSVVLMEIAA
jgi:hypothetical protein